MFIDGITESLQKDYEGKIYNDVKFISKNGIYKSFFIITIFKYFF